MVQQSAPPPGAMGFDGKPKSPETDPNAGSSKKKRATKGGVARWVGVGFLVFGAGAAGLVTMSANDMNAEALAPDLAKLEVLDQRVTTAEDALSSLPDERSSARAFNKAKTDGEAVAKLQNLYGVPAERNILDDYDRVLPEKDQESQDEANERVYSANSRSLAPFFDLADETLTATPGATFLDPAAVWFGLVGANDGAVWTASVAVDYTDNGEIPVMWQLHNAESDLLAWVEADYDPFQLKFSAPVINLSEAGSTKLEGIEAAKLEETRKATGADKRAEKAQAKSDKESDTKDADKAKGGQS